MNIALDKQIAVTKARNNFSRLLNKLSKDKVYFVVKNYIPQGVMVDVDYFKKMQDELRRLRFEQARHSLQNEFAKVLRRKGYDPETVDEKIVNKLLFIDD